MNFCLFLALLVRVTSSLGGEMRDNNFIEAKSQDMVVAQLDIWKNKSKEIVVGRLDICQNKSTHLLDEENVDHPLVSWYAWHLTSLVKPDLT